VAGKPAIIIANTIKGRGHREYANQAGSHNVKLNPEDADKILAGLEA
jgi:transketolase